MTRLRVLLVAALATGSSAARTGSLFGKVATWLEAKGGQIVSALEGSSPVRDGFRRELPPFHSVELGEAGCWPIFTTVAPGDDYAIVVSGLASPKAAAAFVSAVTADGILSLGVAAPGFSSTMEGLRVTIELPEDALRSFSLGPHSAGAELRVRPAEELQVSNAGLSGSQLVLSPPMDAGSCVQDPSAQGGVRCDDHDKGNLLRILVTQGTEPVTVCAPAPTVVAMIELTNNAQSNILVVNYTAPRATVRSTGHGAVYIFPGEAGPLGQVKAIHNGAGEVQIDSAVTDVTQTGSGQLYLLDNGILTGHITGSGNVYYTGGVANDVRVTGSGQAIFRTGPPPPPVLQCPPPINPSGPPSSRATVGTVRVAFAPAAAASSASAAPVLAQCQLVPSVEDGSVQQQ